MPTRRRDRIAGDILEESDVHCADRRWRYERDVLVHGLKPAGVSVSVFERDRID